MPRFVLPVPGTGRRPMLGSFGSAPGRAEVRQQRLAYAQDRNDEGNPTVWVPGVADVRVGRYGGTSAPAHTHVLPRRWLLRRATSVMVHA